MTVATRALLLLFLSVFGLSTSCQRHDDRGTQAPTPSQQLVQPDDATTWYSKLQPWKTPEWTEELDLSERDLAMMEEHGAYNSYTDPHFSREAAFCALLSTDIFAGRTIGGGAITSCQAWAFCTLLKEKDAKGIFADLLKRGHMAGQLYGLCGLALCDRAAFEAAVPRYSQCDEEVITFWGCLRGPKKVRLLGGLGGPSSFMGAIEFEAKRLTDR